MIPLLRYEGLQLFFYSKHESTSRSVRSNRFVLRLITSDWFLGKLVNKSCCNSFNKLLFSSLNDLTFWRKELFSATNFSTRLSSWSIYSFFFRRDSWAEIWEAKVILEFLEIIYTNVYKNLIFYFASNFF